MQNLSDMRKVETLSVSAFAADVVSADAVAWASLERVLGIDPVAAWSLRAIQHVYDEETHPGLLGVSFLAEFSRDTEYEPE